MAVLRGLLTNSNRTHKPPTAVKIGGINFKQTLYCVNGFNKKANQDSGLSRYRGAAGVLDVAILPGVGCADCKSLPGSAE